MVISRISFQKLILSLALFAFSMGLSNSALAECWDEAVQRLYSDPLNQKIVVPYVKTDYVWTARGTSWAGPGDYGPSFTGSSEGDVLAQFKSHYDGEDCIEILDIDGDRVYRPRQKSIVFEERDPWWTKESRSPYFRGSTGITGLPYIQTDKVGGELFCHARYPREEKDEHEMRNWRLVKFSSCGNPEYNRSNVRVWRRREEVCPPGSTEELIGSRVRGCVMHLSRPLGNPEFCPVANPIDHSSGNKIQNITDIKGYGLMPLTFSRFYNSMSRFDGVLGQKWRHNFERKSSIVESSSGIYVSIERPDGNTLNAVSVGSADNFMIPGYPGHKIRLEGDDLVIEDPKGTEERYSRDSGQLLSLHPIGKTPLTFSYDSNNRLVAVENAYGHSLQFEYDEFDKLASVVDALGNRTQYFRDAQGNLANIVFPDNTPNNEEDNPVRTLLYENDSFPHALTGIVDANGNRIRTWIYDDEGRAIVSELANGTKRTEVEYVSDERSTVKYSSGKVTHFNFEVIAGRKLLKSTEGDPQDSCQGLGVTNSYDEFGNLVQFVDKAGTITEFVYNELGQQTAKKVGVGTPEEQITTFEWDADSGRLIAKQLGADREEYLYDSELRLVSKTQRNTVTGKEATVSFAYDQKSQLVEFDGPSDLMRDLFSFSYDNKGNMISVADPLNQVTNLEYDVLGRVVRKIHPNGRQEDYRYGARGELLEYTVDGKVTTYEYDGNLRLIAVVDSRGGRNEFTRDANGMIFSQNSATGQEYKVWRDISGRKTASQIVGVDGFGYQLQNFGYDEYDRKISVSTEDGVSQMEYDLNDQVVKLRDNKNNLWRMEYDPLKRLVEMIDPLNKSVRQVFDGNNRIVEVISQLGARFLSEFGLGNQESVRNSADRGESQISHDASGKITQITDARGNSIEIEYDDLSRVIRWGNDNENIRYTYLQNSSNAKPLSIELSHMRTDMQYDAEERLIERKNSIGDNEFVFQKRYDEHDLVGEKYPSGMDVSYSRDSIGRIVGISVDIGSGSQTVMDNVQFRTDSGVVRSARFGNGLELNIQHDSNLRPVVMDWGELANIQYVYDENGNLKQEYDSVRNVNVGYQYDSRDRIREENDGTTARTFSFDFADNLREISGGEELMKATYQTSSNRLSSVEINGDSKGVTHDANGNIVTLGNLDFTMDGFDRVASVKENGTEVAAYLYDHENLRVQKQQGEESVVYQYNDRKQLIGEYQPDGTPIVEYLYMEATPIAMVRPATDSRIVDYHLTATATRRHSRQARSLRIEVDKSSKRVKLIDQNDRERIIDLRQRGDQLIYRARSKVICYPRSTFNRLKRRNSPYHRFYRDRKCKRGSKLINGSRIRVRQGYSLILRDTDRYGVRFSANLTLNNGHRLSSGLISERSRYRLRYSRSRFEQMYKAKVATCRKIRNRIELSICNREANLLSRRVAYRPFTFRVRSFERNKEINEKMAGIQYIVSDRLSQPILVADKDQNVVWDSRPNALGLAKLLRSEVTLNLRLPGQYFDEETGLHYNANRYYHPQLGRYIQSDPMGIRGGLNTYLYANANPLKFTDPTGFFGGMGAIPMSPEQASAQSDALRGLGELVAGVAKGMLEKLASVGHNTVKNLPDPGKRDSYGKNCSCWALRQLIDYGRDRDPASTVFSKYAPLSAANKTVWCNYRSIYGPLDADWMMTTASGPAAAAAAMRSTTIGKLLKHPPRWLTRAWSNMTYTGAKAFWNTTRPLIPGSKHVVEYGSMLDESNLNSTLAAADWTAGKSLDEIFGPAIDECKCKGKW